ncbi:MAG: nucleoside deaminase [Sedimentisphaerales bacterium]|nr:nucleoside deaminase [Sedimentisphaerales bacterium]
MSDRLDNSRIHLNLPDWVEKTVTDAGDIFNDFEDRMRFVIALSRRNIQEQTGGPFGAGVFDTRTGRLIAAGVNQVVSSHCSIAHAEILALALAQHLLGAYDLRSKGDYELVSSCEPCAMCIGATGWSGVVRLVCGARDEDARRVGFDEGDKPAHWPKAFEQRGIEVVRDILREEAVSVLEQYKAQGGIIYNSG